MEFIISLLMGTRLLTLFGGGLGNEAAPFFLEPKIIIAAASVAFAGIPVLSRKEIRKETSYVFAAQAILGKTRVEALDNKEIDCMYYWNYKRPTFTTRAIGGDRLAAAVKR